MMSRWLIFYILILVNLLIITNSASSRKGFEKKRRNDIKKPINARTLHKVHKGRERHDHNMSADNISRKSLNHPLILFDSKHLRQIKNNWNSLPIQIKNQIKRLTENDDSFSVPNSNKVFLSNNGHSLGLNLPIMTLYCQMYNKNNCKRKVIKTLDALLKQKTWNNKRYSSDTILSSLITGFSISMDIVMGSLTQTKINNYLKKLTFETNKLYKNSKKNWWGKTTLHETCVNNYLALFVSGLLCKSHGIKASNDWINSGGQFLDHLLHTVNEVRDGSFPSSTLESQLASLPLMVYAHLVDRHYGIPINSHHWFYGNLVFAMHEILPVFTLPNSPLDVHPRWIYGPEAQLAFLDKFSVQDGRATWILEKILQSDTYSKIESIRRNDNKYPTLFFYTIWRNPAIVAVRPKFTSGLFHLPDSGLLRYRDANWDLSLRASRPYGATIESIISSGETSLRWSKLIPIDDPPFQGGLSLIMKGIPVFTPIPGASFSNLQNTITFRAARTKWKGCMAPWFGQLGECSERRPLGARAEVLTAKRTVDGFTLLAVDGVHSYPTFLKLKSVQRRILIMGNDMLLIVDHIHGKKHSPIDRVSSCFVNFYFPWNSLKTRTGFSTNFLNTPFGRIFVKITSLSTNSKRIRTEISNATIRSKDGEAIDISALNVTFNLENDLNTLVYIIGAPGVEISSNQMGMSKERDSFFLILETQNKVGFSYLKTICVLLRQNLPVNRKFAYFISKANLINYPSLVKINCIVIGSKKLYDLSIKYLLKTFFQFLLKRILSFLDATSYHEIWRTFRMRDS